MYQGIKLSTTLILLIGFFACQEGDKPEKEEKEQAPSSSIQSNEEHFDASVVSDLYSQLSSLSEGELSFDKNLLSGFLAEVDVVEVKNGNVFEKKVLFESFDCDCFDKLSLSFDKETGRYTLLIYEEIFIEELDWCPESSYGYSFAIKNQKLLDFRLDFMAG